MIKSKEDLKDYLSKDKIALGITRKRPKIIFDYVWKFQIYLRKYEYYLNTKNYILSNFYRFLHYRLSLKLCCYIPRNVFAGGLRIVHPCGIVVNPSAKVGEFCTIFQNVTIGDAYAHRGCPIIGDNVVIGSGAKILGDIHIANSVMIGANAVVIKSVEVPNITIAGVPAKIINPNRGNPRVHN